MSWISGGCKKSGTSFGQRLTRRKYRTAMLVSLERSGKRLLFEPKTERWIEEWMKIRLIQCHDQNGPDAPKTLKFSSTGA
eukprot:2086629-Pleurochrysis_carterae.AAC.1